VKDWRNMKTIKEVYSYIYENLENRKSYAADLIKVEYLGL